LLVRPLYQWRERWSPLPRSSAWYLKSQATFSDCLALVRRAIWAEGNYTNSTPEAEMVLISAERLDRLLDQLATTP
jgi:hypothetical protein